MAEEKKKVGYINEDAEPTEEIAEGGGVHASVGGAQPYVVPTKEEVDNRIKDQEAAKKAHEEKLAAQQKTEEEAKAAQEKRAAEAAA